MKEIGAENIQLIKGFYSAMAENDWTTARAVLDADIEWNEAGAPGLWFNGKRYGADVVFKEVIDPAYGKLERFELKMKKFYAVGQTVVAIGHFSGRGKITQLKLHAPTAQVWTLSNGKAVRFQGFHDTLEWQVVLGQTSVQAQKLAA
jgi:uncharacterized protein